MNEITVNRSDIKITEEIEYVASYQGMVPLNPYWEARLDGTLSTGESVSMARRGSDSSGALSELENAIRDQGWGIQ